MSVNVVYLEAGRKMMRPVLTREEYMSLRDSEQNRRADKQHMVQMNYSLSLNTDLSNGMGVITPVPLKGCKQVGNSVGMDIDLPEEVAQDVRKVQKVQESILGKKEELGLLMLEKSATKGFHIVFKRLPQMSQEENLKWASKVLGVAYDPGAKDITRVFFTPADKLIFLDDAIFKCEVPEAKDAGSEEAKDAGREGVRDTETQEEAAPFSLNCWELCMREAGLTEKEIDIPGVRNWHNSLKSVLSVGICQLLDEDQLRAVVKEKMPNYASEQDCKRLIADFYKNYVDDNGRMSLTLRNIYARALRSTRGQELQDSSGSGEQEEEDDIFEKYNPPEIPKKIPRIADLEVRNFDPRFRSALLLTSCVGRAALASHFRARYLNGKIITPSIMVDVIGGSASGKDYCTQLFNAQMALTIDEYEKREWEKFHENAEMRDKMRNSKEIPPRYHPKIRIFEGASKTSLLELQTNLGENGMLVGLFTEADGFVGSSGAAWSNLSVFLRKGYSGEKHRQYYMSESTCNTSTPLNISMLMEGTPKALLGRLFTDNNCENGLMQRFVPVLMPKSKMTFRPPKQDFLTADEKSERDELYLELYKKDLSLGEGTCLLETPMMNNAIGRWFDELEEEYSDGLMSAEEAKLSHRCGEFMLRAAIPLIALYGRETKEIVNYCVWIGKMAFYAMRFLFSGRVEKNADESRRLLTDQIDRRRTAAPILDRMSVIFTKEQLAEERVRCGQSSDVRMLLTRYCKAGKIERMSRGVYRKVENVT